MSEQVVTHCAFVKVTCECGNVYEMPYDNEWEINIIGLQFICKRCGHIETIPEFWRTAIVNANTSQDKS